MAEFEIAKHKLVRSESLDPNQYLLSLLKEGFRVGLIDTQTIYGIQEQVMQLLKDLIIRYTKGESTSIKTETAEELLKSIYYSIDARISSVKDPEAGIALLKSAGIKEIYDEGVEIVASTFKEARQLCREIVKNKLDVPLEVYNTSITVDLPEFFENYSVVFGAHDTACSTDYPLAFDDMKVQGIFYIKNYMQNLDVETQFCSFFSKAAIAKTLAVYGRTCRIDYKESPVNLFEVLVSSSIFSALSGDDAKELILSSSQYEFLRSKLTGLDYSQMDDVFNAAVEKLITDLSIDQLKLVEYIRRYKKDFVLRVMHAVKNNNLSNIVLISAEDKPQKRDNAFIEAERLSDESFRLIVQRIMDCTNAADKVDIIVSGFRSLEDFIDILNADCLFGDEFAAVFAALGDTELAVLAKVIFVDELRNNQLNLLSISIDRLDMAPEWQREYVRFVQMLSEEKIKAIEECAIDPASID